MITVEKGVEIGLVQVERDWVTHQSFQFISQTAERMTMLPSLTENGSIWLQTTKHSVCVEKRSKVMHTSAVPLMQPQWSGVKELPRVKLQPCLRFLTFILYRQVWSVWIYLSKYVLMHPKVYIVRQFYGYMSNFIKRIICVCLGVLSECSCLMHFSEKEPNFKGIYKRVGNSDTDGCKGGGGREWGKMSSGKESRLVQVRLF